MTRKKGLQFDEKGQVQLKKAPDNLKDPKQKLTDDKEILPRQNDLVIPRKTTAICRNCNLRYYATKGKCENSGYVHCEYKPNS